MIYAPHTLELTLIVDANKFEKLKNRAYEKSQYSHKVFPDKKRKGVCIDRAFKDKGIKVEYHDGTYKKRIKFIVNPTTLLGGDDVIKLWKPNEENVSKLVKKLEKNIERYFNSKHKLKDFKLTRIDFTVNIDVGSRENVSAYIKVLQNIGRVKGFSPKYDDDAGIEKDLSFDLEGNSNGVEFSAYDKEAQLQNNKKDASRLRKSKGILRVEVRLMKLKAIRNHTNETAASKQITSLALNSKKVFLNTFAQIVPYGDHYKKRDAVRIIEDNIRYKIPREKMLRLIELIPKKKSLYLARKDMADRNIDKLMKLFEELNLSPVTISKRHDVKHLKGLYYYLLDKK